MKIINVYITPQLDMYHASSIMTGLYDLHKRKKVIINIRFNEHSNILGLVLMLNIIDEMERSLHIAIDLKDQSNWFDKEALKICDIYLKRNLSSVNLNQDDNGLNYHKIKPFGLNYACANDKVRLLMYRHMINNIQAQLKLNCKLNKVKEYILHELKMIIFIPISQEFECNKLSMCNQEISISFQTRLWSYENETTENMDNINLERVELVRQLKKAFGNKYKGGLVPEPIALQHYPELITHLPTKRRSFAKISRLSAIGVYSRGLHNSLAFKLAEYLASGKCIVSCPLDNQLPVPLIKGVNYLEYNTPQTCVEQCRYLMKHPDIMNTMSKANLKYYHKYVQPANHMMYLLDKCMEIKK